MPEKWEMTEEGIISAKDSAWEEYSKANGLWFGMDLTDFYKHEDQVIAKAAQKKLVEFLTKHINEDSTRWIQIELSHNDWQKLRKMLD